MFRRVLYVAICAIATLLGSANVFAAAKPCDRACLQSLAEKYLAAVTKHDPTAAPLFIAFRETENAIVVEPGKDGLWQSMTGLGKIQRIYVDTVNQSVGYFGTILEGDDTDIATDRRKDNNG